MGVGRWLTVPHPPDPAAIGSGSHLIRPTPQPGQLIGQLATEYQAVPSMFSSQYLWYGTPAPPHRWNPVGILALSVPAFPPSPVQLYSYYYTTRRFPLWSIRDRLSFAYVNFAYVLFLEISYFEHLTEFCLCKCSIFRKIVFSTFD